MQRYIIRLHYQCRNFSISVLMDPVDSLVKWSGWRHAVILFLALYSQINPQHNLFLCVHPHCMCACVCFLFHHIAQAQTVQARQTHIPSLTKTAIKSEIYLPSSAARGLHSIRHTLKPNAGLRLMHTELFKCETVKQSKADFYCC